MGGLGVINTKLMNHCLLTKWIWKIHNNNDELWFRILKAKYMKNGGFADSNSNGGSLFWQGLHKVKNLFYKGVDFSG